MSETWEITTNSTADTEQVGLAIGRLLKIGDVVSLEGGLGVGKTCLAKGIAVGLQVKDRVHSPSFTLVNEYRGHGNMPVYHIDLYRVKGTADLSSIGLEEYLDAEGITMVEWPERAAGALPEHHLSIEIEYVDETGRHIHVEGHGKRYDEMVRELRQALGIKE